MPKLGVYVPYSTVFPSAPSDFGTFCSLVRALSRTDTIYWCARLNLILSNPDDADPLEKNRYALRRFFDLDEIARVERFAADHGGAQNVAVFFRAQLLEVVRWTSLLAVDHENDGVTYEDPEVRRTFVRVALIASDLWGKRVMGGRVDLSGDLVQDRQRAMPAIRESIAMNATAASLICTTARGTSINAQLRRAFPEADALFINATGLTIEQYSMCQFALAVNFANISSTGDGANFGGFSTTSLTPEGSTPELRTAMIRFLDLDSCDAAGLRDGLWGADIDVGNLTGEEPFDLTTMRQHPIFRAAEGRAIILDPPFFSQKTAIGPLFVLAKALGRGPRANEVFGAFGTAFETYINDLLRSMYPSSAILPDRLLCNPKGVKPDRATEEFADACLNDVVEIILFETKGVFVREDQSRTSDFNDYFAELRKKYSVSEGSASDRKVKGVGQLARAITHIAAGELAPIDSDWSQVRAVYPVLVVFDISLATPGHEQFLGAEFSRALASDETLAGGCMRKGRFTVAPLALLTVADVEVLESSVGNFRLSDLLKEYATTSRQVVRPSFHDFMATVQGKYRFIQSRELAARAEELLEKTWRQLFPNLPFPGAPS